MYYVLPFSFPQMHPRMLSIEQVTKSGDWSFDMTVEMYQILPKFEKLKLLTYYLGFYVSYA